MFFKSAGAVALTAAASTGLMSKKGGDNPHRDI